MTRTAKTGWALSALLWLEYPLGCSSGTIDEECENLCSAASLSECAAGKVRSCVSDAVGCLNWSEWANCEAGTCADSERCAGCEDSCSTAGATECSDGMIRTCSTDSSNCLAWDQAADCPSGYCLDDQACRPSQEIAALLFDGSFKATDKRTGLHSFQGALDQYVCLAQPDSVKIVPASTLPGNRPGYAAKFYQGPGAAYDCATNQHDFVGTDANQQIPLGGYRQVWYGFSIMLAPDWKPTGDGFTKAGVSVGSALEVVANSGFSMNQRTDGVWEVVDVKHWTPIPSSTHTPGVWHDFLYFIDYQTSATGSFELWHKLGSEQTYQKIYSRNNFQTEWNFGSGNYMMHRIGGYRATSDIAQTHYIMDFKIGTTRAVVEYRAPTR